MAPARWPARRWCSGGWAEARSGRFYSQARRREVGYTIAWPPGHGPGSRLPLVVMLHGEGRDHTEVLSGMTLPQAPALRINGRRAAADGHGGRRRRDRVLEPAPRGQPDGHGHRRADPVLPASSAWACRRTRSPPWASRWAATGAILLAEKFPRPDQRGGRDRPGGVDELPAGPGGQPEGLRVGG